MLPSAFRTAVLNLLCPIPVMGEPFEWLILDCVGPLHKSQEEYQYILSLMCVATRFPEAVPMYKSKNHRERAY